MKLTFLLPGDSTSGGIRVTMQMGNSLLERGHDVRIAYRRPSLFSRAGLGLLARRVKFRCLGLSETRWLSYFQGAREGVSSLESLAFADGEVVIATGVHTIEDLDRLRGNVHKVRYCHGLLEQEPEEVRKMWLWDGPMDTIAVSPALLPNLRQHCTGRILGVVPNGVATDEYFVEDRERGGVGLIFGSLKVKGPEVAVALVKELQARFPEVPRLSFGACRPPDELAPCSYTRFPSVAKAREIYNRCRIWLITSRDEGFSLPMLEAMACGCAVISSNHTNAGDIIQHGINGFIVRYGDVEGYMRYIEQLLQNESLRGEIVREGFKTVRRFSWEKAADLMEAALQRVCNSDSGGVLCSPGLEPRQSVQAGEASNSQ